jgi:hypothetical protein
MLLHVVLLWGTCAAALVAGLATSRRGGPRACKDDVQLVRLTLPFAAVGVVEALLLTATGHVLTPWLAPLLATIGVAATTRSARVLRTAHRALVLACLLTYAQGLVLRSYGWAGLGPIGLGPGRQVERAWYTPWTGLRPPAPFAPATTTPRPARADLPARARGE